MTHDEARDLVTSISNLISERIHVSKHNNIERNNINEAENTLMQTILAIFPEPEKKE